MRTAIVFNHPYEHSFCTAILQSVIRGLHNAGHETDVLHLDNEQFDPVMRAADLKAFTLLEMLSNTHFLPVRSGRWATRTENGLT
jgi:putative NADPH-quinone reductase